MTGWLWVILEHSILNWSLKVMRGYSLWERENIPYSVFQDAAGAYGLVIDVPLFIRIAINHVKSYDPSIIKEAQSRPKLINLAFAGHLLWPPCPCWLLPAARVRTDSWAAYGAKKRALISSTETHPLFLLIIQSEQLILSNYVSWSCRKEINWCHSEARRRGCE